jgi:hypothetical protein
MFNTAKVAHFYGFPSPQGQKSATSLPVFIVYSGFTVLFVVAVGGSMMLTLTAYHANAAFGQATTKTI